MSGDKKSSRTTVSLHGNPHTLKRGAVGVVGVVFMVVAFSAPISAMTANLPVAVGFGNGAGAPAGFIIATVVLTIFSIGFVALARHITAAGAFYTFVSRGWSRIPGLAAGVMSMFVYMIMEAGVIGVFSAFAHQAASGFLAVDIPWWWFGFFAVAAIGLLSHKDVSLAAKVLGVALVAEIAILTLTAVCGLARGGGPEWGSLMPTAALHANGVTGGSVGLGLLMAFWSWVGFEASAIYGEESTDPKRVVPRATLIAVIGIGVFYTFIAWAVISANGRARSIALASGDSPFELLYAPAREYVGSWAVTVFELLVLGGTFACALAIHNAASRYLFAFGRDRLLWRRLGAAHPRHGSPWIASLVQSGFTVLLLAITIATRSDPYLILFTLVAILATLCLLVVQVMCSIAVITYFHVKRQHPETATWWRTLACPVVGGLGMMFVIYLMATNMAAAAGVAAESPLFRAIPWIVATLLLGSMALAWYLRAVKPTMYERIGRTVFDERGGDGTDELITEARHQPTAFATESDGRL
ncbi:APC family permease [Mycolicibacterium mageritense]|uniref:Putrescine transporter PotE n=1 Tax=Mycolicibacterium mageritense TaxID=53462 RepID=A0AAI8TUY2_MYCME|nr:APC family permease [Mycolicibacterium mageritense]MCC9179676.1 APC family permease [Mycolicibacterium mageritense]BDY28866.1 Putrescine transporter PotE [Mycolicibacterium mageritense]CDO22994.1 amino acid permease-associated protein [Mycolicibacterium mageritense DSM 44476 = CIP 104973]